MVKTNFNVELEPVYNKLGWKSFQCAGQVDTGVAGVVGSAFGTAPTTLTPVLWTKSIVDAAKAATRFVETGIQEICPDGTSQVVIPIRKKYMGESDWEGGTAEPTATIAKTEVNTLDGVDIKPTGYTYLVAVTYDALRGNVVNLVNHCKDELVEFYSKKADSLLRDKTMGDVNSTENSITSSPTPMSNSVNASQYFFANDKTDADDNLATGDILTTTDFRKAIRLLSSNKGYYWNSNVFTKSAVDKNAWEPTNGEPFVFYTSPEGVEAFHGESQFVNASVYGSDKVVLSGEVGEFLGVKVVSTARTTSFSDADFMYGDSTDNPLLNVNGHINMMVKAFKYGATAWGQKPNVKVFDYPSVAEVRLMLYMAISAEPVHADAIVRLVTSDA